MDFLALDVETANADLPSICQIGVAHFSDGKLANEWQSYVDPQGYFDPINVSIHGIDENKTAGAPRFGQLLPILRPLVENQVVVTHTCFDRTSLYQACRKSAAEPLSCTWLDSACVARRAWSEFSQRGYGLKNLCSSLGYEFQHHDALEDAKAAGEVMLAAMAHSGLDISAWLTRAGQPISLNAAPGTKRTGRSEGPLLVRSSHSPAF